MRISQRFIYGAVCLGSLALVGAGFSVTARGKLPASLRPAPAVTDIIGTATGPLFYVQNNGTTEFNTFGVAGAAGVGPYAIGVLGYGANGSEPNLAVTGYDIGPGSIASVGDAVYPEPPTGPGLNATTGMLGLAANGDGVMGESSVQHGCCYNSSEASTSYYAGVVGVDSTMNLGDNAGVIGKTSNGLYGVEGVSSDGAVGGVEGVGTSGHGVDAYSTSADAMYAASGSGPGLYATSLSNNAIVAVSSINALNATTTGNYAAIFGNNTNTANTSTNYGVSGVSTMGNGVNGISGSYIHAGVNGTNASSGGYGVYGSSGDIAVAGQLSSSSGYPFVAFPSADSTAVFYVNQAGDVYYAGSLHSFVSTRQGSVGQMYVPKSTMQTMEDFGSGSIVNGSGTVRLDASFAQMMDGTGYQVFLTPEGDCNGLYISQKNATSFVVHELHAGHASLAFDYRIVARQYGHSADRASIAASTAAFGAPRARGVVAASALSSGGAGGSVPTRRARARITPPGTSVPNAFAVPRAASGLSLTFGH